MGDLSASNLSLATDAIGLSLSNQTTCLPIENQPLASGNSATLINISGAGPGILTHFHLILQTLSNPNAARSLLFTLTVDGSVTQWEGDLWGVSQVPSASAIPNANTPFVWECDHLILLAAKDGSGNSELHLFFRFPCPFSSSLSLTVQNQAFAGVGYSSIWGNYAAQMGVVSPRRLKSSFTSVNTPAQIPSAVEWQSNYIANGGYLAGQLSTNGGVLYQCTVNISGSTTAPGSDAGHWGAVSTSTNQNFNTGYTLLSVNQPVWLACLTIAGQGAMNGGAYGSINSNTISFLEANIAVYDGNLNPAASFPGSSPTPTFGSSGTEDFMGGSFYFNSIGDVNSPISIPSTPFSLLNPGKTKSLRHGYVISAATAGAAFMGATVDLLTLHNGGIRCGTSCLMRWEQGNGVRAVTGPITIGNTWKINPHVLYYV